MNTGMMGGFVVIQAAGVDAGIVKPHSRNKAEDAFSLPHAIPIQGGQSQQATSGVTSLRSLISAAQRASSTPVTAGVDSPLDALKKLGQLRDSGVITAAEFEAKKAEMLKRL
jgi:hypothetical protein